MKQNPLTKKYGDDKRWVVYKKVERAGHTTKIPYDIKGHKASSTDPASWSTFKEVKAISNQIGIVFTPANDLLGIDIDHCLINKKIQHEKAEQIAELILEADTYTEISPSGEGLHLFFEIIDPPFALKSNKQAPFECYTNGRYFTVTANTYGEAKSVRKVSQDEANRLLSIIGYPWKKEEEKIIDKKAPLSLKPFTDAKVLEKMFASKSGDKIRALYGGDLSEYKNDASSADMALLCHLAFWTRKDAQQMEKIWLQSPLGQREKTQSRLDYRKRTIEAAIKGCKNVYETKQEKFESANPDLDLLYIIEEKGQISYLQNTENMVRILRKHHEFQGRFRYDEFKTTYEIKDKNEKWRPFRDSDIIAIQSAISINFCDWFGKVKKDMVQDAMLVVAEESSFDSASDFVKGLKWDGVARIDTWLSKTYGSPEDIYHKAVGSNVMKGLVHRMTSPGCKFDYVLVLEGPQGAKKSTSLAILGGNWHTETTMSTDNKDFFMQFAGKCLVEFSEGETMSRTEVKKMKAIITTQIDRYRAPWGKTSQDFPRHCIFAMTTNQSEYLKDETGNRRWLPVAVIFDQADVKWLEENREQLYAEAYACLLKGETTYEFPLEETLLQQQMRRISDPNEDKIMEWYVKSVSQDDKEVGITIDRVYKECLHGNFPSRPISKFDQMSIGTVLNLHLGLTKKDVVRDNVRGVRWFDTLQTYSDANLKLTKAEIEVRDF